jgi:hypothetical protein
VPDDQVTIDPEFSPPPPSEGQARRLRTAGAVGVVVAAFAFGWLLRSPTTPEEEPGAANALADTVSTTQAAEAAAPSSTTTRPSTTTTTTPSPETFALDVSLGEAVPEFTDVITMEQWEETGIDVVRWRSSQFGPETIEAFRDDGTSWYSGFDAAGTWYVVQDENGVLSAHRLGVADPEPGWLPDLQAVGVRVSSQAWHDTEPGKLAWLSCSRTPGGPGTLFLLDVADRMAEPVAVRQVDHSCSETAGAWLHSWGDWGFSLEILEGEAHRAAVLDAGGNEIGQIGGDSTGAWMVAGSAHGTIWAVDPSNPSPSWILASPDARSSTPVPGLVEGEWLDDARWSPDGTRLALSVRTTTADTSTVRIVEVPSGAVVAEIAGSDWETSLGAWSTDSRFLVYQRWTCLDGCDSFEPEVWVLAFYDTLTETTAVIDLPTARGSGWGDMRLTDAIAPAELVAHYPLDGDASNVAGYGRDGTVSGATPTKDRFGTSGAAYSFDGENDLIAIPMTPLLQTDAVSIAAWVRRPGSATPRPVGGWRNVVSYGAGGHVLAVEGDGAVLGGLQGTGANCEVTGNDTVFDGGWHHVAMTRDPNWTIRVYLDGVVQPVTSDAPASIGPDTATGVTCTVGPEFGAFLRIGADPANSQYFLGSIDDVRIYAGTLTDDEVTALATETP